MMSLWSPIQRKAIRVMDSKLTEDGDSRDCEGIDAFAMENMDTEHLQMYESSSEEEDEIQEIKHRKSMISIEQNLMEPCDQSLIVPESLRLENSFSEVGGSNSLERLLMERLLLRKELRLRNMQERLLEQDKKIAELEAELKRLREAPGYKFFEAISNCLGKAATASGRGYHIVRIGINYLLAAIYQMVVVCFLSHIPSSLAISASAMVQRAGTMMAQSAENFSNECVENLANEDSSSRSRARGGNSTTRRRRR